MRVFFLLLSSVWAFACSAQVQLPRLDQPPGSPAMFAQGVVSTSLNERDFALSPDGKEIFYTITTPRSTFQTIVFMRQVSPGVWTPPSVASFAGRFSDIEPAFSPDGMYLYFASNRPIAGTEPKDFDIWRVKRTGSTWGPPENLGQPVNTEADEFYPSVARSGSIYWTSDRPGGPGREDIFVSSFQKGIYQTPVPLDTAVNSRTYEFNAFVDPDERFILFTSYGRKDDMGGGDLYISEKGTDGKWQKARNLNQLNSKYLDYCPFVSPDGKTLFFTSERNELPRSFDKVPATVERLIELKNSVENGTGNVYWVTVTW